MKAVVLDGTPGDCELGLRLKERLLSILLEQGWNPECFTLRDCKIGDCAGDFYCWIKTPGACRINDDNRHIARAYIGADLAVLLTPVTFGGYSSILKRAWDHLIQNISPFFSKINGETHHKKRYSAYPDLLVIGYENNPERRREAVFHYLVQRNAINYFADLYSCIFIHDHTTEEQIAGAIAGALQDMKSGVHPTPVPIPERLNTQAPKKLERLVLLVGSPRTHQSTSLMLGNFFLQQFSGKGAVTDTFFLHTIVRSSEKMQALAETIDNADLVVLSFPLYVDSLPAPVINALEQIAAMRREAKSSTLPALVAIANSGFPETEHNLTALAICETFAGEAGFSWSGGLSVGSGAGLVNGKPLAESGGRTSRIKKSLEIAAAALAGGEGISAAAQAPLEKPVIPHWMYRTFGDLGWRFQARQYGVQKQIQTQPYR